MLEYKGRMLGTQEVVWGKTRGILRFTSIPTAGVAPGATGRGQGLTLEVSPRLVTEGPTDEPFG